ncbi:MAG: hypothetical protein PHS14_04880 [Elusimicrobia bacterium]|nr:hypothetical protein [Elusimicrobiota bacterium]
MSTAAALAPDPDFHVDLEYALLCVDCSHVYQIPRQTCPACGSGSGLQLAKILDAERNRELVRGLRALSKLLVWAKRPTKPRVARSVETPAVTS